MYDGAQLPVMHVKAAAGRRKKCCLEKRLKMNYGIITIGSQGDIDPFIALGKRLQSRGHHVRIAAFRRFEEYIRSEGFEYAPLAGDAVEVIRLLIGEQVSPFQYFHNLETLLNPIKDEFLSDVVSACKGMDAILYSLLGAVAWHAGKLAYPVLSCILLSGGPDGGIPGDDCARFTAWSHLSQVYVCLRGFSMDPRHAEAAERLAEKFGT